MFQNRAESSVNREFWRKYWEAKGDAIFQIVPNPFLFSDVLSKYLPKNQPCSFLEIGGFPGYFSVFFNKFRGYNVTLIDYFINREIIEKVCKINEVEKEEVTLIEADLFDYTPVKKYDVVFSAGFIEHFDDTEFIVKKHVDFVCDGGFVVIALPNFRGINGMLQKICDPDNLRAHNLGCMDISFLKENFLKNNLKPIYAGYYGRFALWLENNEERSYILKQFIRIMNFFGPYFCYIDSRLFSPYILVVGKKVD